MKFELTTQKLEEMVCCIVDCDLDRDEACKYAIEFCSEDAEEAEIIE